MFMTSAVRQVISRPAQLQVVFLCVNFARRDNCQQTLTSPGLRRSFWCRSVRHSKLQKTVTLKGLGGLRFCDTEGYELFGGLSFHMIRRGLSFSGV